MTTWAQIFRRMGLPPAMLKDDFNEKWAEAQERHAAQLAELRRLEAEEPEFWCNLPWSAARKEWEEKEGYKNLPCTDPRLVVDPLAQEMRPLRFHHRVYDQAIGEKYATMRREWIRGIRRCAADARMTASAERAATEIRLNQLKNEDD